MEKALKMYHYSKKYGVPPYKLTRHLHLFETIVVDDYVKPWIIDNESNRKIANRLALESTTTRPKLPRIPVDEFMQKYNVSMDKLKSRWKSLNKEVSNGEVLIADIANNRKHFTNDF